MFCHFYFTCSREKGSLFTVFREIGKKINVQDIFNCSFIMKWQFYFAFFRADTPPLRPSLKDFNDARLALLLFFISPKRQKRFDISQVLNQSYLFWPLLQVRPNLYHFLHLNQDRLLLLLQSTNLYMCIFILFNVLTIPL